MNRLSFSIVAVAATMSVIATGCAGSARGNIYNDSEIIYDCKGKTIEKTFKVSPSFSSINSKGFINVVFNQSDNAEDFSIHGLIPEKLIDLIDVRVENNTLYISMKKGNYRFVNCEKTPTIYVTNRSLCEVSSSGSGDFTIKGDLNTGAAGLKVQSSGSGDFRSDYIIAANGTVSLSTAGSGDMNIEGVKSQTFSTKISGSSDVRCSFVETERSVVEIKGSGDVRISGKTDTVEFSIAGSGDIDAGNFIANSGKASISGSGDIKCNVDKLSCHVRGSGNVYNRN